MDSKLRSILTAATVSISTIFVDVSAARAAGPNAAAAVEQHETKEQRDARMKWWREARFGMFIHWGLYAVPAGEYQGQRPDHIGEWIMLDLRIPVADYAKFAEQFNPVKFDADAWVRTAKDAGMKYIVITSKHHDGFAMFRSSASPYNIVDATPFKRDPLKELAEACQKHGMKLGFYYSQAQDWHHPGGAQAVRNNKPAKWDAAQEGSMDDYIDKVAAPQVKEILSNYGPVAVLWWDTPVDMNKERAEKLVPLLKLQPGIITNNRLGGGYQGDTETPEQYIPPTGYPGRDWETCMTMNKTWGYKHYDHDWKSTETLLRNLIDIASKGGNYLLNVGPTAEGVIPQPSIERLAEIGKWMKVNGDAIYGTSASPFRKNSIDGRFTVKGDTLFVHVFNWPDDGVKIGDLRSKVKAATLLDGGANVEFTSSEGGLVLKKPAKTDPIATVVALKLDGPADVDNEKYAIKPAADGSFALRAKEATVSGTKAKYDASKDAVGTWTNRRDAVLWDVLPKEAGEYAVAVTYASPDADAGGTFNLRSGESVVTAKVEPTGEQFKTAEIGRIRLAPGVQMLMVQAKDMPKGQLMTLREVKLTPVK